MKRIQCKHRHRHINIDIAAGYEDPLPLWLCSILQQQQHAFGRFVIIFPFSQDFSLSSFHETNSYSTHNIGGGVLSLFSSSAIRLSVSSVPCVFFYSNAAVTNFLRVMYTIWRNKEWFKDSMHHHLARMRNTLFSRFMFKSLGLCRNIRRSRKIQQQQNKIDNEGKCGKVQM